ncbi:interleukin-6 receptor subunit beta isoform 2-T4 [Fundulus diaphanus]
MSSMLLQLFGLAFIASVLHAEHDPPKRATNISCVAEQKGKEPSFPVLSCTWETVGHQIKDDQTTYTLMVEIPSETYTSPTTPHNKASVSFGSFPHHTNLDIWVVSQSLLGKIESEHLRQDAHYFVKTSAPSNVKVIVEQSFPTSLLVKWQHPIHQVYIKLTSQIRFCQDGSHDWRYVDVPNADTSDQTSFRLQDLQPGKDYVIQVRCKNFKRNQGYWSDWSDSVTEKTPEDRPTCKPDLWWKSENGEAQLICKEPKFSNGRITAYSIKFRYTKNEGWEQEIIPVNGSGTQQSFDQRPVTLLKRISLADKPSVRVCVAAINSVGTSPEACLHIPAKPSGPQTVEGMNVSTQDGQMFVEWKQPNSAAVTEYVIEWMSNGKIDWQRERNSTNKTAIKGKLQPYVCYNVSVYPIQSGFIRKPARLEAYFEQGAPSEGPNTQSNPAYDSAELWWNPVPLDKRRGFITNYTIFYQKEHQRKHINVPGNITSYDLTNLSGNTKYDVWITASTIAGSKEGIHHSFTTLKYAPGMVAGVVVGVSLGFLFFVLMTTLLCFYKKEVIKKNFWPQIPNPGESTIGNWSPDYPSKVETPKENCVTGVCVLNVGVCEVTPGFEEDKTSLSLKKDKYLSEEHSSGIGGSSCMSSPRQSVSDSDEGPDLADSTASTVQYSSVVASSGYKGQTPAPQPQHSIFSRSESTQPLLDSEEHPDIVQEGSRQVQCSPRESLFTHGAENQNNIESDNCRLLGMEQHDFCPLKEEAEQTTESDSQSADASPSSSYMPQLGGYRPQ